MCCFQERKIEDTELGRWRGGEDLGGGEGRETVIRTGCRKRIIFNSNVSLPGINNSYSSHLLLCLFLLTDCFQFVQPQ